MAYRNQNYMTNRLIKETVDKNQKDYVDPAEVVEEFTPVTYNFISYGDAQGEIEWGQGTVETTGVESNGYSQVKVKTNSTDESFIGEEFYIISSAKTDGTIYELYTDAGTTSAHIYVSITQ